MTGALFFVAALLLVGVILRHRIAFFRWLFIPASVIAGLVGLLVVQTDALLHPDSIAVTESTVLGGLAETLRSWPGWLIAVVFAGMLLERKTESVRDSIASVARQGLMVWIIVLGQTAIGLTATWLLIQPMYDVPNSFGVLIETGFAGGHGTAAAMGEVFQHPSIALEGGLELGVLMATVGLVYGIVTGILWINVAIRMNWITVDVEDFETSSTAADFDHSRREPIGYATISRETIDPLLLQVIWLTLAFGIGMLLQTGVSVLAQWWDGMPEAASAASDAEQQLSSRLSASAVLDFPLFIYTLFGGLAVRRTLERFGLADAIDHETIHRLTSTAMDILVVAAIASLNLVATKALFVPFTILFVGAAIWTAICLLVLSRRILPSNHWFPLGLINYGMSTGTTATGFVLLRVIDPQMKSGAAEDYALAAPLSAPFIGGGLITVALPLIILERIPIAVSAMTLIALVAVFIAIGIRYRPDAS